MLEVGQIIKLDDDKEYIVINKMNVHSVNYVYLITNSKPLEIMIATEKIEDGKFVLKEIKDNDELDYVLSQFSLSKDEETEID